MAEIFSQVNMLHRIGNSFKFRMQIMEGDEPIAIDEFDFIIEITDARANVIYNNAFAFHLENSNKDLVFEPEHVELDTLKETAYAYHVSINSTGGMVRLFSGKFIIVDATHAESIEVSVESDLALIQVYRTNNEPIIQITNQVFNGHLKADLVNGLVPKNQIELEWGDLLGNLEDSKVNDFVDLKLDDALVDYATSTQLATKLDASAYNDRYKGKYNSLSALNAAVPTANPGDYAQVDAGANSPIKNYNWDAEDGWVIGASGSGATNTDALPEGSANLYFTASRVQSVEIGSVAPIVEAPDDIDSLPVSINKLRSQVNNIFERDAIGNDSIADTNEFVLIQPDENDVRIPLLATIGALKTYLKNIFDALYTPKMTWLDWSNDTVLTGWVSTTVKRVSILKDPSSKTIWVDVDISGTSNSPTTQFTIQNAPVNSVKLFNIRAESSGAAVNTNALMEIAAGSNVVACKINNASNFGGAGTKSIRCQFFYVCP